VFADGDPCARHNLSVGRRFRFFGSAASCGALYRNRNANVRTLPEGAERIAIASMTESVAIMSVVINADPWQPYIETHPVLFQVTPERNVQSIVRLGLRPRHEVSVCTGTRYFKPRSGRVYLIEREYVPIVAVCGEPRVLEVDVAALEPQLVDPDEDMVAEKFPKMVSVAPPRRLMNDDGTEAPGQQGARTRWADLTPRFDRGEVTEQSLANGRISYRGVIAPDALTLIEIRSPTIEAFLGGLPDYVRGALPSAPMTSGSRNEIERARVLVTHTIDVLLCLSGVDGLEIRVSHPREVRVTAERLLRATRPCTMSLTCGLTRRRGRTRTRSSRLCCITLTSIAARVHGGSYRAKPSRRVFKSH